MSDAFGIDFGTTNSVLARATPAGTEAIALDPTVDADWQALGFDKVLPSVISFEQDGSGGLTPLFGWRAKRRSEGKLEAVKRLFATEDVVTIDGVEVKVEEAAAMFFRHVQRSAAEHGGLPSRLDHAVVTIPANSRGRARYRTKLSAGLAGIEVMALINEPTAAAMAHARTIGQNQRVLVFDWGGGTLDVTVLQSFEGTFIEQASKGIQRLGGIDLDEAFQQAVLPRVAGSADWSPSRLGEFRLSLERAKIELSRRTEVQVELPTGGYLEVTRALFEEAVLPLLQRTRLPVEQCLHESPGRVDHLVMVGGSSKMPAIRRVVTDLVGTDPSDEVDPMTAIAEGAAIAAGVLQGTLTDLDFWVATEHALGTVVHNDPAERKGTFAVLIPRNMKLPASATDEYLPADDFQEEVRLQVIEGDPGQPIDHDDNVVVRDWVITLPEARMKEDASFTVTYEYDVDGILHVRVRDQRTGSVMMDEELAFGAGEDRSQLPSMRRTVDDLMGGRGRQPGPAAPSLSPESEAAVRKARDRVMPFVVDEDRRRLEVLVAALEGCGGLDEAAHRTALEGELRAHAYLL